MSYTMAGTGRKRKMSRTAAMRYAKYGNKRVFDKEYGWFDSELEKDIYIYLTKLQEKGEIHDLKRQVEIEVIPKTMYYKYKELKTKFKYIPHYLRPMRYVADFTYYDKEGNYHVGDAKGYKTKEYIIKKKILLAVHGIYIEEWSRHHNKSGLKVDIGFTEKTDTSMMHWTLPKYIHQI